MTHFVSALEAAWMHWGLVRGDATQPAGPGDAASPPVRNAQAQCGSLGAAHSVPGNIPTTNLQVWQGVVWRNGISAEIATRLERKIAKSD
jgi:hypothetical protein